MARKNGSPQETPTGGFDGNEGDDSYALWTQKAGRKLGFDFRTQSAIFGNGKEVPIEFLEGEARRDKAVYGRIILMDSLDFATVQESFNKRLQHFEKTKKPALHSPQGSPRAHAGPSSVMDEKMDRHAGWQSPSYELPSDAEIFTRQPAVPEACPQ